MKNFYAAMAMVALSSNVAAKEIVLYPVQTGAETVRFLKGVPTLDLETEQGAIQITPLPFDHGKVSFAIGVYNKSRQSANFGIENFQTSLAGIPMPVLSRQELQKRAKSRAAWSQVGMALLAGAAAYGASQLYTTQTASGRLYTPRGVYSWSSTYRDNTLGVIGAAGATAAGTAAIVGIQQRLDYTLTNLADEIIQTTTVDPDASYGGRIVIEKTPKVKIPYDVVTTVSWNGTNYPFTFRVTYDGVNVPPPYVVAPAPAMAIPAETIPAAAAVPPTPSAIVPTPLVAIPSPAQAISPANGVHVVEPTGSVTIITPSTKPL